MWASPSSQNLRVPQTQKASARELDRLKLAVPKTASTGSARLLDTWYSISRFHIIYINIT